MKKSKKVTDLAETRMDRIIRLRAEKAEKLAVVPEVAPAVSTEPVAVPVPEVVPEPVAVVPVPEVRDARFAELDKLISKAADFISTPKVIKTSAPSTKSKFEFVGVKNSNGVACPDPGGWGSFERPYSSLASLQNDSRVYNRSITKYREITLGVAGPWIMTVTTEPVPVPSTEPVPELATV